MSRPPEVIRIKRRREDDAPVQALYIESRSSNKRQRFNNNYVFKLAHTVDSPTAHVPSPTVDPRNAFSTVLSPPTPRHPPKELQLPDFVDVGGDEPQTPGIPITRKAVASPGKLDTSGGKKVEKVPLSALLKSPAEDQRMITPVTPLKQELPSAEMPAETSAPRDIKRAVSPVGISKVKKRPTPITKPRVAIAPPVIAKTEKLDADVLSPATKTQIRRFHFTKRVKFDSSSLTNLGKKRDRGLIPVFVEGGRNGRVSKKRSTGRLSNVSDRDTDKDSARDEPERPTRRKPRIHPLEKAKLEEHRSRETSKVRGEREREAALIGEEEFDFGSDELTSQLQAMVLDYISSQPGLENLPPTQKKPPSAASSPAKQKRPNRLGGGLGGGTWTEVDKQIDIDMKQEHDDAMKADAEATMKDDAEGEMKEDAEGEWVYDVYYREEVLETDANFSEMTENDKGVIGVLVISNSDDEQWSFGNEDDADSDAKVWGSDDEDSNAEDFHTNDYPDEESGEGSEGDHEDDEEEYDDEGNLRRSRPRFAGEDDYDADYDLDVDDDRDDDSDAGGAGGRGRVRAW